MEALGSAATLVQIISFTGEVLVIGYGYLSKVSKAPTQIRALLRETAALNDLLAQIQELVDNEREIYAAGVLNTLDRLGVLSDCNELIGLVQKIVKKCGQVVGKDVQKTAKNLLWPFKENETKDLMAQLSRLREILSTAIAVDSTKALRRLEEVGKAIDQKVLATLNAMIEVKSATKKVGEDIAFVKSTLKAKLKQEEKSQIRRWLHPDGVESEANFTAALNQRTTGTGTWLLDSQKFQEWSTTGGSCIWLYGIAGSGKTVLAATAIQHLMRTSAPSATTVLYFFCDHRDPNKQSIGDFFHAIIKQLLDKDNNCFADAEAWLDEKNTGALSAAKPLVNSEYIEIIRRMCSRWISVSIVLDALDECTGLNAFVDDLVALKAESNVRLLLTSRHDIEVIRAIQPIAQHTVSISDYMRNDIKIYLETEIKNRIGQRSLKLRESWLEAQIATSLEVKADGLILIAKLHLDYLSRLRSDRAILEALDRLPSHIYETYDEILLQICTKQPDDLQDIVRVLQWLAYSIVPLTLEQASEIISIRPEDETLDPLGIATDLAASLGSLVTLNTVDTTNNQIEDLRGPRVTFITLAHYSVEEYLKSGKMVAALRSQFYLESRAVHLRLARACLQYVGFTDFSELVPSPLCVNTVNKPVQVCRRRPPSEHPAAAGYHFPHRDTDDGLLHGSDRDLQLDVAVPLERRRRRRKKSIAEEVPSSTSFTTATPSIYSIWSEDSIEQTACFFEDERAQILELSSQLIEERRKLRNRTSKFAFYDYACRYWADHLRLSEFAGITDLETMNLLSWFIHPSKDGGNYGSWQQMYHRDVVYYCPGRPPLHYAIDFRIDSLVSLVLLPPDEIDTLSCGVSALHVAARAGAISTVRKLLDLGASVHLRSACDPLKMTSLMTAMHFAAEGGHADVLQLLLEHGASPDVRNESGSTPFMRAARSGSLRALKVLYDAGVDINAEKEGFTPLFESVAHCRPRIACQLLHWGADPSIKNIFGESTLTLLKKVHNGSFLDDWNTTPNLEEDKYSSLVSFYKSEEDFLGEIDALQARKAGPSEYLHLMRGLKRQYSIIKQMEKDTRSGTEREKDYRFPHDPTKIVTMTDFKDRDEGEAYLSIPR